MKPAIDQMISWIDAEMARYSAMESVLLMDKGYRVLDKARTQAMKIKERCDADEINQVVAAEMAFNNAFGAAAFNESVRMIGNGELGDAGDVDDVAPEEFGNAGWKYPSCPR